MTALPTLPATDFNRTIPFPDTTWEDLGALADQRGTSRGQLLLQLAYAYIKGHAEIAVQPATGLPAPAGSDAGRKRTVAWPEQLWDELGVRATENHLDRGAALNILARGLIDGRITLAPAGAPANA
jgi:hypothetical protein